MKKFRFPMVPPLILGGMLLILLPIFTFMTLDRLKRQREFFNQRLIERGTALMRTFEAGTRTGMLTMRWGAKRIQAMLYETSLQPDVLYLFITDREGRILAHSDAEQVGKRFDSMPASGSMGTDSGKVFHRIRPYNGQEQSFEMYKRFVPIRPPEFHTPRHRRMGMGRHMRMEETPPPELKNGGDWSRVYERLRNDGQETEALETPEHYIFTGLSMEKGKILRRQFVRQTIWRAVIFFVLGTLGMVALSAFQAYQGARASLSRVKAFSDSVIHQMPGGLLTVRPDGKISSINPAALEILGGPVEQMPLELSGLMNILATSEGVISREVTVETGPDRQLLLDVTASSIRDSEGEVTEFLFLFKDMTQVRNLKKQVETNRRLAAIGKLAAGVAHEIRNPLSSIKGFATYFGKRYADSDTDRQTAQVMVSEVERIDRSISQLLEFAKPMAVEKQAVDIWGMIDHSLALVQYDLETKNIQSSVTVETGLNEIYTDGERINQVLLNLYINAVQAMEDGGRLQIRVSDTGKKGWLDIEVKDTGKGIDPEELDLIFDPYFTTRPTGTGLGLSIVHRIVENLGGSIRVDSEKGKGTCFTISLPLAREEEEE